MSSDENKFEFLNKELHRIRKEKKLSQELLAEKVGVSRQSIHLWENGRIIPDYENVINLCNVLNINPSEIISGFNIVKEDINKQNERKNNKNDNIKKIIKINLLIVVLLFIIVFIKRVMVIININNSIKNYKELDYYAYKIVNYCMIDNNVSNFTQEEVSLEDGIYKRLYKEENINKFSTKIDFNKNEGENVNYLEGTTRALTKEEILSQNRKDDVFELRESVIESKKLFTTIIYSLNPQLKIKVNDNYIIEYKNHLGRVKVWINKDTGLVTKKIYEEEGKTVFEEYEYKL